MTRIEIYMKISSEDLHDAGKAAGLEGQRLKNFMTYTGALLDLDVEEHGLVVVNTINGVEVAHPSRTIEEKS